MFKMFRGMFGQPKDLPESFSGDALQYTFDYMKDIGEKVSMISDNLFEWQFDSNHKVFFEKDQESHWIRSFQISKEKYIDAMRTVLSSSIFFAVINDKDEKTTINKWFYTGHMGDPAIVVDGIINQWRMGIFKVPHANRLFHFRSYLNGKTFSTSTQAFAHYMQEIQKSPKIFEDNRHFAFDTGGPILYLQKDEYTSMITLSYNFTDLSHLINSKEKEIEKLLEGLSSRNKKVSFFLDEKGVLLTNIFFVGAETDAMELFTVQLKVIHDAVLDYGNQLHFAPELEWAREDAKKRGIYRDQD